MGTRILGAITERQASYYLNCLGGWSRQGDTISHRSDPTAVYRIESGDDYVGRWLRGELPADQDGSASPLLLLALVPVALVVTFVALLAGTIAGVA